MPTDAENICLSQQTGNDRYTGKATQSGPSSLESEHIDSREPSVPCDAIPKVDRKTDITGPKRIPTAASNHLSAAILEDGSHGELARAVEPNRVIRASVELEECVAISARPVATVRA